MRRSGPWLARRPVSVINSWTNEVNYRSIYVTFQSMLPTTCRREIDINAIKSHDAYSSRLVEWISSCVFKAAVMWHSIPIWVSSLLSHTDSFTAPGQSPTYLITIWKVLRESTNPRESVFIANTWQHLPHLLFCGSLVSNFPTELFCKQSPFLLTIAGLRSFLTVTSTPLYRS